MRDFKPGLNDFRNLNRQFPTLLTLPSHLSNCSFKDDREQILGAVFVLKRVGRLRCFGVDNSRQLWKRRSKFLYLLNDTSNHFAFSAYRNCEQNNCSNNIHPILPTTPRLTHHVKVLPRTYSESFHLSLYYSIVSLADLPSKSTYIHTISSYLYKIA